MQIQGPSIKNIIYKRRKYVEYIEIFKKNIIYLEWYDDL